MSDDYLARIGTTIKEARHRAGLSQADLATKLETSQSAVARIEAGGQNLTLDSLARISEALDTELVALTRTSTSGPVHLQIGGGRRLSGAIDVKTSKNAAVALLCASLLNKGTTTLRNLARIGFGTVALRWSQLGFGRTSSTSASIQASPSAVESPPIMCDPGPPLAVAKWPSPRCSSRTRASWVRSSGVRQPSATVAVIQPICGERPAITRSAGATNTTNDTSDDTGLPGSANSGTNTSTMMMVA